MLLVFFVVKLVFVYDIYMCLDFFEEYFLYCGGFDYGWFVVERLMKVCLEFFKWE